MRSTTNLINKLNAVICYNGCHTLSRLKANVLALTFPNLSRYWGSAHVNGPIDHSDATYSSFVFLIS